MTAIELLRTLFYCDPTMSDHQVVALVYEEFCGLRAEANARASEVAKQVALTKSVAKVGGGV